MVGVVRKKRSSRRAVAQQTKESSKRGDREKRAQAGRFREHTTG